MEAHYLVFGQTFHRFFGIETATAAGAKIADQDFIAGLADSAVARNCAPFRNRHQVFIVLLAKVFVGLLVLPLFRGERRPPEGLALVFVAGELLEVDAVFGGEVARREGCVAARRVGGVGARLGVHILSPLLDALFIQVAPPLRSVRRPASTI
jgi:hypothetical protein